MRVIVTQMALAMIFYRLNAPFKVINYFNTKRAILKRLLRMQTLFI